MSDALRPRRKAPALRYALFAAVFLRVASGQMVGLGTNDPEVSPPRRSYTFLELQRLRTLDGLERHRVRVKVPGATRADAQFFDPVLRAARAAAMASPLGRSVFRRESHVQD